MVNIKLATTADLAFLLELEQSSFSENDRFRAANIKRSLSSKNQSTYIIYKNDVPAGAAIVWRYLKAWRLYSIAVLPAFQNKHLGGSLLFHIIQEAQRNKVQRLTLEVHASNTKARQIYTKFGFNEVKVLPGYYGENDDGVKMEILFFTENKRLINVVVTDLDLPYLDEIPGIFVITPSTFINDPRYHDGNYRVFNMCETYSYQTVGYYISLFAAARQFRIIPSIATIEDFTEIAIVDSISEEISDAIKQTFKNVQGSTFELEVIFGLTRTDKFSLLAYKLYKLFPAPFLRFTFSREKSWILTSVDPFLPLDLNDQFIKDAAVGFFSTKKFMNTRFRNYKYDLAILVDEEDKVGPSNKQAIARFVKAAQKIGFYTEIIHKEDYHRLNQFDALFIRATTNPQDYTYKFSRLAYAEGLIVIDDPWSILRCANKVYFHESMKTHNIKTPPTLFVTQESDLVTIGNFLGFPLVLKRPDSSSSKGVFKVNNLDDMKAKVAEMFIDSAIIVAQKFLQSSFDWRVGILNGKAIFVSKYYMAKNHWQIFKWKKGDAFLTGNVDTFLVEDAPQKVVSLALKAAALMGEGLYGVDIKEFNGNYYVIEVNDNPSVDHGVEDLKLGQKLYEIIIQDIFDRIEQARNYKSRELLPSFFQKR